MKMKGTNLKGRITRKMIEPSRINVKNLKFEGVEKNTPKRVLYREGYKKRERIKKKNGNIINK